VNAIIDRSGASAPLCQLWNLHEPLVFAPWRASDQKRYDRALPWNGELQPLTLVEWLRGLFR
jgi:hypothetical protein